MSTRCLVVGSGASGMSAAIILAKQGYKVTLVERAPKLAPILRGFSRPGLRLDSGFHYSGGLGAGKILSTYLDYLGVGAHISLEPHHVVDTLRIENPQGHYRVPYDYQGMVEELAPHFPEEVEGLQRFLAALRTEYEATPFLNLDVEEEPERRPMQGHSLQSALDLFIKDPVLHQILSLPQYFYGVPPKQIRFEDHARFSGSYFGATRAIKGGGYALTLAFEKALQEANVEIVVGDGVSELLTSPAGNLYAARLESGLELPCTICIVTTHPRVALDLAPKSAFRPAYAKRIATMEETASAFMTYGVVSNLPDDLASGGVHLCPAATGSLADITNAPPERRHVFVALAGEADAPGASVVGAVVPAAEEEALPWLGSKGYHHPGRNEGYKEFKEDIISRLESRMLACLPELAGQWQRVAGATPLTFMRYGNSPTGSLYGVQHTIHTHYPLPQTKLPGLYLAGQGVAGPGVLGATVSSIVACSFITGRRHLLQEVRQCA